MKTADQLQAERDTLQKEADSFVGKLKGELKIAQEQQFAQSYQEKLKADIQTSEKMYQESISAKDKEISDTRAQEIRDAAQKQQAQELTAAEEKQKIHDQLKAVWIDQKGDPEVFEQQFPQLYAAEMQKRTLRNTLDQDPAIRAELQLIHHSF